MLGRALKIGWFVAFSLLLVLVVPQFRATADTVTAGFLRDATGALDVDVIAGGGSTSLPTTLVMNCTAAGANTLACTNAAGSTVCVNNAATQTCTVSGTTAFYGIQNVSGSSEPAGFQCYNSASTTPPAGAFLGGAPSSAPLGAAQVISAPAGGGGEAATNITCVVSGGTALLNTGGVQVTYR